MQFYKLYYLLFVEFDLTFIYNLFLIKFNWLKVTESIKKKLEKLENDWAISKKKLQKFLTQS